MSEVKNYPPYLDYPKPRKVETTNDCISRKSLLDRYDAEHVGPPGRARELIATAPAADVVEVVRCENCIRRGTEDCAMYYGCECGEQHAWETDNDFCSWGERRDNAYV